MCYFKFTVYVNLWYMAASKHTHACAQCSPASVGLAQASPNYLSPIVGNNYFSQHTSSYSSDSYSDDMNEELMSALYYSIFVVYCLLEATSAVHAFIQTTQYLSETID